MENFTPLASLAGGMMIGAASVLLMALHGRIAGISDIAVRALPPYHDDAAAGRAWFLLGLVAAPLLYTSLSGSKPPMTITSSAAALIVGGLLVGFGAVWGNGCTSGHGVCGLARLSPRSFVAVATFMATAIATAYAVRHLM